MAELRYSQLKLRRAYEHLQDVSSRVEQWRAGARHRMTRALGGNPRHLRFHLEVIDEPDDDLTLAVGDFVVNLRSGLDHLIHEARGAGKRHRDSGWPFWDKGLWEWDEAAGRYRAGTDKERERFMKHLPDVPDEVVRIVKNLQPGNDLPAGAVPYSKILNRLANADKHGDIFRVVVGFNDPTITITIGPYLVVTGGSGKTVESGGEVAEIRLRHDWLKQHYPELSEKDRSELIALGLSPETPVHAMAEGSVHVGIYDSAEQGGRINVLTLPDVLAEILEEYVLKAFIPIGDIIDR